MATYFSLPPPTALDIHDSQASAKWKKFKLVWTNYAMATELDKKPKAVRVATLLTVIEEAARDVFSTFTDWVEEGGVTRIEPVLMKFQQYCQSCKNVAFERYRFNGKTQEPGEAYDQYRTALRKLAGGCEFQTISPGEILRDRLIFGLPGEILRDRLIFGLPGEILQDRLIFGLPVEILRDRLIFGLPVEILRDRLIFGLPVEILRDRLIFGLPVEILRDRLIFGLPVEILRDRLIFGLPVEILRDRLIFGLPGEILRDRLIFGIKDDKVRERLLRESNLTLVKTDEICRAAESLSAQMKVLRDNSVSVVKSVQSKQRSLSEKTPSISDEKNMRECWNCGGQHEYHKKELCPAFGNICSKCRKPNHFSAKCRGARPKFAQRSVRAVDEEVDEVFPTRFQQ